MALTMRSRSADAASVAIGKTSSFGAKAFDTIDTVEAKSPDKEVLCYNSSASVAAKMYCPSRRYNTSHRCSGGGSRRL